MPIRQPLALVCALLFAVAAPTAALAQSAGDDQYSDPFGSSGGGGNSSSGGGGGNASSGSGGGGGASSGSGSGGGVATSSQTGTTGTGTGTGTATGTGAGTSQGPQLARTGSDTALIALAGAGLLLCGVGLRMRTHPSRR